ncbi:TetR/AcrR family transcriptional regulator [Dokdonia sp.]|uniref:TetR/AcrR family transcriptional regulator n=1 Tax=Dokdonia sp. TaxID=2024995 RepID=UPI0032645AFD
MRPQKIENAVLLERLTEVFRSKGYEGSSLNDLATSAGLKKASLYHRFPGGKEEIAAAVLQFTEVWSKKHVEDIIRDTKKPARQRLQEVVHNIDILYAQGEKTCILRALSTDTGIDSLGELIQETMNKWLGSFAFFAEDIGYTPKEATQKATQTLINIQGSLIISKGLNDRRIFKNALNSITTLYYPIT